MNYNIKITKNTDYSPTYWSGGMASELITYPEGSSFAERNFLWR
ncbi:MAG: HutD-family protein, partial [Clostridium sp.]